VDIQLEQDHKGSYNQIVARRPRKSEYRNRLATPPLGRSIDPLALRRLIERDAMRRLGSRATLKVKPHFNAQPQGQAAVFPEILTLNSVSISVSLFAHSFARALRASSAAS
jgi:hypothetical protein